MQSISITRNGSDAMTIVGTTVSRFLLNYQVAAGTVATKTFYNTVITVMLQRDGEASETILSGPCDAIPRVTGVSTAETMSYLANIYGMVIDLPQPINLSGNDRLNVRIQSGAVFQTSAPAELDYTLTLTACGGTGIENWTPTLSVYQVPSGQTNWSQSFGDYVRYITIVQPRDKTTQVQIESSYYSDQFIKEDIQALIMDQYGFNSITGGILTPPDGSVTLYGDKPHISFPLMGVRMMGTVNTGVTGNVYICCWAGKSNPTVKSRALKLRSRIANATAQTIPSIV